jgi:outer membrane protein OmpA-like peptidoglycan-associated protein
MVTMRFVVNPLTLCFLGSLAACSSTPAPAPQPAPTPVAPAPVQLTFDYDSDHIQEEQSRTVLDALVALMRQNPQIRRVRVEGHTDLRGNASHNQELSQRRAQAVMVYLRAHGFESIQFEAVGYGMDQPLCREDNDACHDRNRRVEFTITDPAAAP